MSAFESLSMGVGVAAPAAAAAYWAYRRGCQRVEVLAAALVGPFLALAPLWILSTLLGIRGLAALIAGGSVATAIVFFSPPGELRADRSPTPLREPAAFALIAVVLASAAFVSYGLERDDGVHRMAVQDWGSRLVISDRLMSGDRFPPANPFLPSAGPSRRELGFELFAATVARSLGDSSAWKTFLVTTLLTLAAVSFATYSIARGLYSDPRLAALAAAAATLLAGFDALVVVAEICVRLVRDWPATATLEGVRAIIPMMPPDAWIERFDRQFSTTLLATLRAPQHTLAAIVGLLAFHWLSSPGREAGRVLVCGLAFAAVPLLSLPVALTLGAGVALAVLIGTPASERRRWLPAAAIATLLTLPLARLALGGAGGLIVAPSGAGSGLNGALFTALLGDGALARLLDTPILYLIDFGLVGALAALAARRDLKRHVASDHRRRVVLVVAAGLLVAALVRPAAGPNDVYSGGLMVPWILSCCLAAGEWPRAYGRIWGVGLLISVVGTIHATAMITSEGVLRSSTPLGVVALARAINEATPPDAVVAMPMPGLPDHEYWLRRPLLAHDPELAIRHGATEAQTRGMRTRLDAALATPAAAAAAARLQALGADVVAIPIEALPTDWGRSPCFAQIARGGDWLALRVVADCHAR